MLKVFFLIFEPGVAWERIAQARRGMFFILATYLLPMIALMAVVEGWGLNRWGKWQPKFDKFKNFSLREIISFEILQALVLLAMIFICALLLLKISETFHARRKYLPAFTVIAYGFSPFFLLKFLDAGPTMPPAATWAIGIALTMWILYQGIPRVLQPDATHAFGIYLSGVFVVVLVSGMARLITAMYLLGYMDFQHSWLTHKLGNLLGQ